MPPNFGNRTLFHGDNINFLRGMDSGTIHLIARDRIADMVGELRELVNTHLDGAGVFGWRENADAASYEAVPLPATATARVSNLDDVLHRIASEIRNMAGPDNEPPPPVGPPPR